MSKVAVPFIFVIPANPLVPVHVWLVTPRPAKEVDAFGNVYVLVVPDEIPEHWKLATFVLSDWSLIPKLASSTVTVFVNVLVPVQVLLSPKPAPVDTPPPDTNVQ